MKRLIIKKLIVISQSESRSLEVPFSNMVEALKEFKPKRFLVTKLE